MWLMRQQVQGSSHVQWLNWDPASRVLTVEYKGARLYEYAGVDYDTWVRLMKAPSKGVFLRREIQPRFPGKAVAA